MIGWWNRHWKEYSNMCYDDLVDEPLGVVYKHCKGNEGTRGTLPLG